MDGRGVPQAVLIGSANTPDQLLLGETLEATIVGLEHDPGELLAADAPRLCPDRGYRQQATPELVAVFGYVAVVEARDEEASRLQDADAEPAKRWIVERTISRLNRYRRLLIRWDKRPDSYLALLQIACTHISWRNTLPE